MAQRSPDAPSPHDLHAEITDQLIAAIEANPAEPQLPWRTEGALLHLPRNALTGRDYRGINILALWVSAARAGFTNPVWATYKQWAQVGAQVRRGEKASTIVFYKQFERVPDPDHPEDDGRRRVGRASSVFNADQVEGYNPPASAALPSTPTDHTQVHPRADTLITGTGADIRYGGDQAFYHRKEDFIQMPDRQRFTGTTTMAVTESHYAVLLHELAHWTGAPHRLNRIFGERFGDAAYAVEELVAEIASAFLCADLQITSTTRPDHATYVHHWLQLLRQDKRAIFVAAAKASEATSFLHPRILPRPTPAELAITPSQVPAAYEL